ALEIKRTRGLFYLDRGDVRRRFPNDQHRARRMDNLHTAVAVEAVGRTQHLVPRRDLVERALQRVDVEPAREAKGDGHVVLRAPLLQPIDEPEALLRERER